MEVQYDNRHDRTQLDHYIEHFHKCITHTRL